MYTVVTKYQNINEHIYNSEISIGVSSGLSLFDKPESEVPRLLLHPPINNLILMYKTISSK